MSAITINVERVDDDGCIILRLMQPCAVMGDIHENRVVLVEGDTMTLYMETVEAKGVE